VPVEEATAAVTFRGKASAVQKAADRFGARRAPQPAQPQEEEDDTYSDDCGELMADGRNKLVVTRVRPKKYEGLKVKPIRGEYDCPTTKPELEDMVFQDYGGERFRVAIYPDTATSESKPPLGAFNITNHETDQPWEPEDEGGGEQGDGRPVSPDPYSKEDRSPGGTAKRIMAAEAEHLEDQINVKRLRKTLKQVANDDDDKSPARDPADDRVRVLEERLTMRDVESRMEKRLDELKALIAAGHQPKSEGKDVLVTLIQTMNQQTTAMLTAMQNSSTQMMQILTQANKKSDDGFESLEKMARLKTLFGGDNDRFNELINVALDKMFDSDKGKDDPDESDIKYAINKLEPSFNKFVESMIEDKKKKGEPVTKEQLEEIKLEAARKAAKEMQEDLAKRGYIIKLPDGLPGPAQPPPKPKPQPQGERDMANLPPAPGQSGYDRKKAIDFVLDEAIADIKAGRPKNSYLPWDIVDGFWGPKGIDQEMIDGISRISTGAELEQLIAPYADPAKFAEVKELGKNELVRTWLNSVVTTAQNCIAERKVETAK
jgi:hypothetical protein